MLRSKDTNEHICSGSSRRVTSWQTCQQPMPWPAASSGGRSRFAAMARLRARGDSPTAGLLSGLVCANFQDTLFGQSQSYTAMPGLDSYSIGGRNVVWIATAASEGNPMTNLIRTASALEFLFVTLESLLPWCHGFLPLGGSHITQIGVVFGGTFGVFVVRRWNQDIGRVMKLALLVTLSKSVPRNRRDNVATTSFKVSMRYRSKVGPSPSDRLING